MSSLHTFARILRHASGKTTNIVLQCSVLFFEFVMVLLDHLDAFSNFNQVQLDLTGVSKSS